MITRETTIVEKEFDKEGNLIRETTTTGKETDNNMNIGKTYPPFQPYIPDKYEYKPLDIRCDGSADK